MSISNAYPICMDNRFMKRTDHSRFIERLYEAVEDKERRKNIKITRNMIAKNSGGLQGPAVTQWKSNKTWPKMANAVLLASWLDVGIEWLLTGRGAKHSEDRSNNFNASPEQQGLNQYWSMMTKEDQRSLLSLAARFVGSSKDSEGPVPPEDTGTSEKENA